MKRLFVCLLALWLLTACSRIGPEPTLDTIPYAGRPYVENHLTDFNQLMGQSSQGTAGYGNYIVQLANGGYASVLELQQDGSFKQSGVFLLASADTANHCNQAMFGPEKFDESDPMPLLFVTTSGSGGTDEKGYIGHCAVERLLYDEEGQRWHSELVQSIYFNDNDWPTGNLSDGAYRYPNSEYQKIGWGAPAYFVDHQPTEETKDRFYIFSARFRTKRDIEQQLQQEGTVTDYIRDNAYLITAFDMPQLPESADDPNYGGSITLTPANIRDQFTTEYDIYITQGGTLHEGRIYYSFGFGGQDQYVYPALRVFALEEREIVAKIDLRDSSFSDEEPECCFIWGSKLGLSTGSHNFYQFDYIEQTEANGEELFDCVSRTKLEP